MKKLISVAFLFLLWSNPAYSDEKIINSLKEGGKLIFIRHAIAPGNGDPTEFKIDDCSTQRNLNQSGIDQSKIIGLFFNENKLKIDKVLSSEWCRCKDTAEIAFKNFKTFKPLNSFYDPRFADNEKKQIKDLKKFIKEWDSDKNIIFVTHYVVILSLLNMGVSSGEIVVADKDLNVIGSIETF
jgi:phosphohistidine phosphatase SixA